MTLEYDKTEQEYPLPAMYSFLFSAFTSLAAGLTMPNKGFKAQTH